MIARMEKKEARPIILERFLRVQTEVDIIFNADSYDSQADVRPSRVLDINPTMIAVAQTSPPILKSMINSKIEATFIHHDMVTSEHTRWGWGSRIVGINNDYIPESAPPDTRPVQAVFIAQPPRGGLHTANVRLDYRLTMREHNNIIVKTMPAAPGATLVNFSAGGAMIAVPGAPQVRVGAVLHIFIAFPWPDADSQTLIKSKAEVVRIDYARGAQSTKLGLKFHDMDVEISRTFSKIINYYMLAEQRMRSAADF